MNQHKLILDQLIQSIDSITRTMCDLLARKLFDEVDGLFIRRQELISELMALHASGIAQDEIRSYFDSMRERDRDMLQMLQQEANQVKSNLLQLGKVKQYITR